MTIAPPPAFVRLLNRFFAQLGYFVADHDRFVIIATLLFTAITSAKIAFTRQEDDIRTGYTPFGARSRDEMQIYNDYFAAAGDPISIFLFITAKDGGSMARLEHLQDAVSSFDFIAEHIEHKNRSFFDLCTDFCQINEPIRQYLNGLSMGSNNSESRIALSFPTMEVLGRELDLSPYFFGVRSSEANHTVEFVKIISMQLRANPPVGWHRQDVNTLERKIANYYHKQYHSDNINVYAMSLTFVGDEIVRTGLTIFPFLAVGFTTMSLFSVLTVYYSSSKMDQWSRYKAFQAVFACVCPLLACASALGFLFWLGVRFGTILCVTPFLVLAIGVDDAYLMMHSWMRVVNEEPLLTKRERVSRMLVDVGPSITITSLTNCLAFVVGIYTPTPEIQLFCIGNAAAIFLDWVYQITIYCAAISISGEKEMKKEDKKKAIQWNPMETHTWSQFLDDFAEWISSKFTAMTLLLVMCIYWYISVIGAMDIKIMLSPDKLVLSDSLLLEVNHLRDHYVLQNYTTVQIIIQNPGDLSDPHRLEMSNQMISAFEALPECLGSKFSHYFVRDYLSYKEMAEDGEDEGEEGRIGFSKRAMDGFLKWPEFQHWNGFVKFDEDGQLDKYFATVSYHGELLGDFQYRKEMLNRWRAIGDSFPALNISVFDDYSPFVDQLDVILPATLSTSACTLLCMMVVCFLFMYNLFTVIVATISIVSICIGVFGFLSFWGVDLDPISMATTIMSIGFSVDFPAHITFHYFREGLEDPDAPPAKRIARSLAAIGFPLLQCGLSTIIFVLCLLFVKTYMSEVFVKTMVLVVALGLIHGLVLVPAFLCALSSLNRYLFPAKTTDLESASSGSRLFAWRISSDDRKQSGTSSN